MPSEEIRQKNRVLIPLMAQVLGPMLIAMAVVFMHMPDKNGVPLITVASLSIVIGIGLGFVFAVIISIDRYRPNRYPEQFAREARRWTWRFAPFIALFMAAIMVIAGKLVE